MANYYICLLLFRIILPVILTTCVVIRPSAISGLYLLLLLILPLLPIPTATSMKGSTGLYLKILVATAFLTSLAQLSFQIVLLSMPPYGAFLENTPLLEKILRHVGLVTLDQLDPIPVFTWLLPEVLILIGSLVTYILCKKFSMRTNPDATEDGVQVLPKSKPEKKPFGLLVAMGKYAVLAALCLAAVFRPSVSGGLYFMVFLATATWWSCYKQLGKGFAITMKALMVYVVAHIWVLYAYQFEWPQELLQANSTYARYFGLTDILQPDPEDPRVLIMGDYQWDALVNPFVILLLYYVLALESKFLLMPQLIRGVSPTSSKRYGSSHKRGSSMMQDSTGSVTVTGDNPEDIQMDELEDEYVPTVCEHIMFALESILQMIIKSSYIGTNIIMMAWSITYLSWITFVLLIWANLLWLVPNQRQSMLRSSPFLVIYAWFLLISAYIYSMDLTEEELPSVIQGINLSQIGFHKVTVLPCTRLLVKCLFTAMFWITLRQFMQERRAARQSSALADMVAPLQVTVGTAAGVSDEPEHGSLLMERLGQWLVRFLTKFWIWGVAITLFVVAITGQRMTVFRILYMALFLFFVLSFQLSFRAWRKMMVGFWLTVIVYSMIMLVLVYTYQFDNFQEYWRDYLHIPIQQQLDIGLEKFETKQLFVRLVTPTFFVIITVIQLHYFHKDFMELSDPKNTSPIGVELDESSLQGGVAPANSDLDETNTSSLRYDFTDSNLWGSERRKYILNYLQHVLNLVFIFLELHMPKLVLLFLMLLCVYDKCALNLVQIVLIVLAFTFGRPMQIFAIYCSSIFVSFMLLARMIYQIDYIEPGYWNVTCDNGNTTEVENNANWLGFNKTMDGVTLPILVQWNIVYILVVTLWAVILVRQFNYRVSKGRPTTRAFFMFPKVTRADADQDLSHCLKYLANYGFYKFGVEICFMVTVALIGFRMDMYASIYSIWLCILFNRKRSTLASIWNMFLAFIAISLVIQYVLAVGLPPTLCVVFPWDFSYWGDMTHAQMFRRLQDWAFLLDDDNPPSATKLICDFVLLLLVSRQSVVFRIEKRYAHQEYPGGSNESILHHAEEPNFVNPVPDFISYVQSYLDVLKRLFLSSFLWITLALVFLAGTNRVNLFSIGYLGGAFIFLWQGSDLYLRPIPKILKAWDYLLAYNVFVIMIKTILQIVGCIFLYQIPKTSCWPIQLFGIGCVNKFGSLAEQTVQADSNECVVPREFVGLAWDGFCFGFLIMQRRIFNSYNFFHMIDESKATTILASRGAVLIEELRQKRTVEQEDTERKVLEKIKTKMDKIKANQQRIQGASYKDTTNHFIDSIFPRAKGGRRRVPKTYKAAIRSGDYYMFDDLDDDDDLALIDELEQDDKYARERGRTVSEIEEHVRKNVTIASPSEEEPQPGTSKDEDISEQDEPKLSLRQKFINFIIFIWFFINSSMISLTLFFNKYSKDYRYVMRVLTKEKKVLKENTDYQTGLRVGPGQVWQPAASYHSLLRHSRELDPAADLEDYEAAEMSSYDQPAICRLLLAIWYLGMSRSDWFCYVVIFLNQIKSATFLSLPLPLMVFLWGTLTIPRPSKNFWVTIIAYTEVIVLIKCMFQFELIPWNMNQSNTNNPFHPPRIIGIERTKTYAVWDLILLLVVFFHRFMLKSMGLWTDSIVPAALVGSGQYRVTADGDLVRITSNQRSEENSPATTRRPSDLQRLVEDSEEPEEETYDLRKSAKLETDLANKIVIVETEIVNPLEHFPQAFQIATLKYVSAMKTFFVQLRDPTSRVAADVYSYMFLCDFFNFFVILMGYSAFGTQQGDGGVSSYLEDDRVPVLFLLMLILQFLLIIVDRGIFLRKNILAKILFQFIQVFILHIWLFIVFPLITERGFNSVLPPQMYYMVKCFYLLLSAYQIRCGYPTRILGNFLCKGYNYVNMFLFKTFMAIPFLFELRTVMDWMWTDTSMTVFDWIKMEDIFAHIFQLKCSRHVEDEYPQPRGEKKNPAVKYAMGGAILFVIIAIIWFPLVFFSLGNAVGQPNPPYDVTMEIRIGPYAPVYQMSAQSNSIYSFTESNMEQMRQVYVQKKYAATFISNYVAGDVAAVKLSSDSANTWSISPPDRQKMVDEVESSNPLSVRLEYKVSHKTSKPEDSGVIPDNVEFIIPAGSAQSPNPARESLRKMLTDRGGYAGSMLLSHIMPKFLKVTNRGTAKAVSQLMFTKTGEPVTQRSINLSLNKSVDPSGNNKEWWNIQENCDDTNYEQYLSKLPYADCNSIMMYTFNDKIFPSTLNIFTGGGIVGLYTTLVFVASRFLRGFFADQCFKIMFEDMPNIDRVLQLCLDIYLVREAREFTLEEDLFAKLVFLFRSPETLIKWTRPKEEVGDDEDPEGVDA